MPLPVDLDTLPVYLWERYRGVPFQPMRQWPNPARGPRRDPPLLVAAAGLRLAGGLRLGGPWAGRLAVGFIAASRACWPTRRSPPPTSP